MLGTSKNGKMVYCIVVGCKNGTAKKNTFIGSMHKFPHSEKLRGVWISKVKRKDYTWKKWHRICSDHFTDEDYVLSRSRANEIGFYPGLYQLQEGAVPSRKLKDAIDKDVKVRKSLAVTKRKNLETMRLFSAKQAISHCDSLLAATLAEPEEEDNVMNTESQPETCEKQPATPQGTHVNVSTQACAQVSEKQVECKPAVRSKQVQCYRQPRGITRGSQTRVTMVDKSVSCDLPRKKIEHIEIDSDSGTDDGDRDMDDPDYDPEEDMVCSSSDEESDNYDEEIMSDLREEDDRKFIVFASCLRFLLAICHICSASCRVLIKFQRGTAVTLQSICTNNHTRLWSSQPMYRGMAEGNLSVASALFFSGSSAVKTMNMFKFAKIQAFSLRTFEHIQRSYLFPSVTNVWERMQFLLFSQIQEDGQKVSVGGDARCDSPGYCAKYGTYSLLDVHRGLILSTQLVQCNEVGSSAAMEKEGLIRCIEELQDNNIHLGVLITDRHPSVKKYMKENQDGVKHYFDVWHMAKGIKKKLNLQGQKRGYSLLTEWQQSITNHLYWAAASSEGDGEMVKAKWKSLLNHVCNVHEGHSSIFPECAHGELGERSWFKKGSREYKALVTIVENDYLMKDVPNMSPKDQTSALEGFHKLVCFFAPKQLHYPYTSMKARCVLAALHFNENASRNQKRSKNGMLQWKATYPKYRKGDGVLKAVKGPCTYDYVDVLMAEVAQLRHLYPTYRAAEVNRDVAPPTITMSFNTVPKDELIRRYQSRFK